MKLILSRDLSNKFLKLIRLLNEGASGESAAAELGVSRVSVWKMVKKLEEWGYTVEKSRKGYRIVSEPDLSPFRASKIVFETQLFQQFVFFKEIDSTNRIARELNEAVVMAEKQIKGRGRLGRYWMSESGGLYFSMTLSPGLPVSEVPKLTLTAGVAVAEALSFANAKLKWPNDVLVDGKKVCGILSEVVGEDLRVKVVVGVGINVSNPVPDDVPATNLRQLGYEVGILDVFELVMERFSQRYSQLISGEWERIREKWVELSDTLGRKVKISVAGKSYEGIAVGIDSDGALLIEDGELKRVFSGECFYVK
jgi:BirA family biotin operon repressor/biotin-[acetyl-CoA-carboxylase] ligase